MWLLGTAIAAVVALAGMIGWRAFEKMLDDTDQDMEQLREEMYS